MTPEALRIAELEKLLQDRDIEISHRNNELDVINSVQEALLEKMDLKAIYDLIGDKIREIFKVEVVYIAIRNISDPDQIDFPYYVDRGDRLNASPLILGEGLTSKVIIERQPLLIGTMEEQISLGVIFEADERANTYLGIPIIIRDFVIGVVSVQSYNQHAFSDSDVRLLSTLSSGMGNALENARLFDETQHLLKVSEERAQELAILNSVGEAMAKTLDIKTVTHIVGEKVRGIFRADVTEILLCEEGSDLIYVPYAYAGDYQEVEPFKIGTGLTSKVILTGKPLILSTLEEGISMGSLMPKDEDITESYMGVPIIAGEKMLGVVSVQSYQPYAFNESDVRLLSTLSSSMSVALENARLFDETNRLLKETEQRTAELAVINSVQDGLARELDMQSIYELVGEKIRTIFNAQVVDIVTYDKTSNLIKDQYAFEKGDRTLVGAREPNGFRKRVIETSKTLTINKDVDKARSILGQTVILGEGSKSIVLVPMIAGGEITGIISLQNLDQENAFSDSDVNLLTTLANSMSVALENARLFDETNRLLKETEQRTAELAIINSVQEGLASKLEIHSIYDLVGEKIREIFGAQVVDIVTYDPVTNFIEDQYAYEKGDRTMLGPREINGFRKHVVKTKQLLLHNDNVEKALEEFNNKILIGDIPKSQIYVPMIAAGEVKGIISLQNLDHENAFSESDVKLIITLSNSMSVALESARLFDETNRLLKETEQRTAELAVINSVQDGLAKELDIQGIYLLVGEKMREIFNAQVIDIVTYDPIINVIEDRYAFENGDTTLLGPREPRGIRKHLIDTGELILVNKDAETISLKYDNSILIGQIPKSALFVPLMSGGKVSGIMSLQNLDHENAFSDSDVNLLTTLANSMSVALESARLFDETNRLLKETEQRTRELSVINSVQEGLAKELDINGIYELVGEKMREIFNAQVFDIATYDKTTQLITDRYNFELGDRTLLPPRPLIGFRKWVIENSQPLMINHDIDTVSKELGNVVMTGEDTKSVVFVPMMTGGEPSGVMSLQHVNENVFSESDVRLLTTLGNSMSVALENARLFDETNRLLKETEQRTAELAVINSVQDGLAKELDIQGIYNLVGDRIQKLFNAQVVMIASFDHEKGMENFNYHFEKGETLQPKPRNFDKVRKHLIETGQYILFNENIIEAIGEFGIKVVPVPGTEMPKSILFMPLKVADKVTGYVSLQNIDTENAFSNSDVSLLSTLSNSMSVALENARLFDETNRLLKETEQRTSELAIINSVQEGLASKLDIQSIYDLVGDKIRDVFDTQGISLSFYDRQNNFITHPYYMFKGDRINYFGYELGKGLTSHIIQTGQPLLINSNALQRYKELGAVFAQSESEENTAKSWLGVPLISGGLVNGTIRLENYEKEFAYTDSDVSLLQTLANSMSVALENARLFDETNRLLNETEQRTAELAVINSVQEGLAKELDMHGIYDLVGDRLCELFPDTQTLVIRTFNHATGMEHFHYAIEKGNKLNVDTQPFIWASKHLIRDHKPIHINENYLETSKKFGGTGVTKGKPPKSAVFVPMLAGDIVKGSVSLQNVDKENAFSESDVRLLTTITNSMSVALENARLFDETTLLLAESKQRAAELSTVNNISKALAAQLDPADLIQMVGDQLKALFNANIVYIAILNKKTNIVNFPYQYGDDMAPLILGEGLTSKIIQTGEPILINKDLGELRKKMGIQLIGIEAASYLGVPIPLGDENIGVLSVQSTEQENRFDENDMRLLTTIASSVGVALNNATLFEDVKVAKMEAEEASKAAERANDAKSAFLSTVSHELRTPLTSVLGFAKIIRKRLDERVFPIVDRSDPKTDKAIHQISENLKVVISEGERLTHLINDVLDLAKIEAGKMEWNQEDVSMAEVAERAIAATTSLFDQKALKLIRNIDSNIPAVTGDKDKLIQVIINLISNSVKFTDHGSVTCRVSLEKDEVVVSISDTGIGIAPEDFGAVFEQFKQVGGDTLTDKPKGTGLGLPICKEIVEHHGGRIWLESEQGKGSSFIFSIPTHKENVPERPLHLDELVKQLKEQVADSELNKTGRPSDILIVDDDDSIRSLLHQELGDAGYQIREAKDGKEALEMVKSNRPDLIVLDIMMPEMNGFDVAAVLKNDPDTMNIPIIVLSVVQDKARGFRIGVDRYLTKPIDTGLLFNEIGSLLELGKSRKKVIIADEDAGAVEILREVLAAKGYDVSTSNEKELAEKAKSNPPDIIMINAALFGKNSSAQSLRFEKGMEKVLFVMYQ